MIDRRQARDRRSEHRFQTVGRISWRPGGADHAFKGYISDSSESGLSFVAGRTTEPHIGELVELQSPRELHPMWKVVRIEDYDANLCLVACEALPAVPSVTIEQDKLRRLRTTAVRIS